MLHNSSFLLSRLFYIYITSYITGGVSGCIEAAALQADSAEEFAQKLVLWEPKPEEFTNGLVVQIFQQYNVTFASKIFQALTLLVHKLIGVGADKNVNTDVKKKLLRNFQYTEKLIQNTGASLTDPWVYLDKLKKDGDPSDDVVPRCDASTQSNDNTWRLSAVRYKGLYNESQETVKALQSRLAAMQEELDVEQKENSELKVQLKAANRAKGGFASSFSRVKKSFLEKISSKNDDDEQDGGPGGDTTPVRSPDSARFYLTPAVEDVPDLKYVNKKLFYGEKLGQGKYGRPLFLRIDSSRNQLEATNLSSVALFKRAHLLVEVVALISGDRFVDKENGSDNLKLMMTQIVKLFPWLAEEIVSSNPNILKKVMTLEPEEANKFMLGAGLTWNNMRKMSNMLQKLRGCRLFCSEQRRRIAMNDHTRLLATDKLLVLKLSLYKTSKSKFPTLQPAVKIANLPYFICDLVREAKSNDVEPGSLQDIYAPEYGGRLRVTFGCDKGNNFSAKY